MSQPATESEPTDGEILLAIDPGRVKCGLAVVSGPIPLRRLALRVVETERLTLEVGALCRQFPALGGILLGSGTGSAPLRRALQAAFPDILLRVVDEHGSSARARRRFVAEIPAPGWRRFLPPGLRSPERPYDDYVALLLAEEYFQETAPENLPGKKIEIP